MTFAYLLMALVGAACAIFALQNMDPVVIRFLAWRVEGMPVALVILLSVLGGLIFASCIGLVRHWKLRGRIRRLEAQLAQAQQAVQAQQVAQDKQATRPAGGPADRTPP